LQFAVLVLSDIFIVCAAQYQYQSDSSWHCPQDNHFDVCGVIGARRWWQREWGGGVKCTLCCGR